MSLRYDFGSRAPAPRTSPPLPEVKRLSRPLFKIEAAGVYNDFVASFVVDHGSPWLHGKIALGFLPTPGDPAAIVVPQTGDQAWTLTLDAWDKTEAGVYLPSNNIVSGLAAPFSYEAVTANNRWRGLVAAPTTAFGAGLQEGTWWLTAEWRASAAAATVDPSLIAELLELCDMQAEGLVVSVTGV